MHIERKYYTESEALWDRVVEEVDEEWSRLTDAERAAEDARMSQEFRAIQAEVVEELRRHPRIPDQKKLAQFHELVEDALIFAEECDLDIIVDLKEEMHGSIQLENDSLFIIQKYLPHCKQIFIKMILMADEIRISPKGEIFNIQFIFNLFYQE